MSLARHDKRGGDTAYESSDDDSMMPPQALPVAYCDDNECPADFSGGLPETPEEYLAMVRQVGFISQSFKYCYSEVVRLEYRDTLACRV